MSKLIACKTCGKEIAKSAKSCPHCGARQGLGGFRRFLNFVGGIFLLLVFVVFLLEYGNDGASLPRCESSVAQREVGLAIENAPMGQVLGLNLIKITDATEISASNTERLCRGTALLTNANSYPISFRFYVDLQNDVMVEARVEGL